MFQVEDTEKINPTHSTLQGSASNFNFSTRTSRRRKIIKWTDLTDHSDVANSPCSGDQTVSTRTKHLAPHFNCKMAGGDFTEDVQKNGGGVVHHSLPSSHQSASSAPALNSSNQYYQYPSVQSVPSVFSTYSLNNLSSSPISTLNSSSSTCQYNPQGQSHYFPSISQFFSSTDLALHPLAQISASRNCCDSPNPSLANSHLPPSPPLTAGTSGFPLPSIQPLLHQNHDSSTSSVPTFQSYSQQKTAVATHSIHPSILPLSFQQLHTPPVPSLLSPHRRLFKKPPFDHRDPYAHFDHPFHLDNCPELLDPTALVFPLAQQEKDPHFSNFPPGSILLQQTPKVMAKHNPQQAGAATANQNLVGHRIDGGRLEFVSILGLGAYGVVYLAKDLNSPDLERPRLYAVKALNKVGLDARQKSFQRREIALHSLSSAHPSVVTLYTVIETPSCIFVVLDYCPDGDLFGMITEKQYYLGHEDRIKKVLLQIIDAVVFCHMMGIAHRDLKPENILCKNGGDLVLLADFGLATAEGSSTDFGCGSTFYMSPECQGGVFQRPTSYSTLHNDIWSLGVIIVNMTCGRNPWKQACPSDETFRAFLGDHDFLRSILPISQSCNNLLKRIFTLDPSARISLSSLRKELIAIDRFTMTRDELRTATKATREAARAWQEIPSPRIMATEQKQKEAIAKSSKVYNPVPQLVSTNNSAAIWNQSPHFGCSSSNSTMYSCEGSVSEWTCDSPRASSRQLATNDSAMRFITPPHTPRTAAFQARLQGRPHGPKGNLVSAFTSTSLSSSSSASFESPFVATKKKLAISGSTKNSQPRTSKDFATNTPLRKQAVKAIGFQRPNAPSPILVEPSRNGSVGQAAINHSSPSSNFLLCTPPPSASPKSGTFGLCIRSNDDPRHYKPEQQFPFTPLTPSHVIQNLPTGSKLKGRLLDYGDHGVNHSSHSDSDEESDGAVTRGAFSWKGYPGYADWVMVGGHHAGTSSGQSIQTNIL